MPTIAQQIEKRAFDKGRQEGLQQSRQQGSQQKAEHVARELLKDGYYPLTEITRMTGLSQATVKNLVDTLIYTQSV